MALVINTNIASIQSERALAMNRGNMETAMERLSSGKRINSAIDDASGIAVAQRMSNQIKGLNMAIKNANDGISMAQTAEGSMEELQNILLRMRELAVQSSNGTYTTQDRSYVNAEFSELMKEIRRVSTQAFWDGQVELIGENARPMAVQVGLNAADYIEVPLKSCTVEDLNLATTKLFTNTSGGGVAAFNLSQFTTGTSSGGIGASTSGGLNSQNIVLEGDPTISDVDFRCTPLPTFKLSLWDGSRLPSGAADDSKVVDLTAGPVAKLSDLVAQLKAHSNYDPTVCDLQAVDGRLQVVWKIQGAPAAPADASLEFSNPAATSASAFTNTSGGLNSNKTFTITRDSDRSVRGSTIAADTVSIYGRDCIPQKFTFTNSTTNWFVPPGPDTHFELRIGDRVLSAENPTSVDDLVQKLQKDSDYGFVLSEAGHPDGFPLFEASTGVTDASGAAAQKMTINFSKYADSIGSLRQTTNNITIAETDKAITALDFIDKAADVVNDRRARMGATMSRIEYTINNLMNVVQNTEEAKSRILDTDYAAESAALAKAQVLAQAGTAMLAQANQSQQYVLNLLKGM